MKDSYDVFISYSHVDKAWVQGWLLPRLESAGIEVCIDCNEFDPGAPAVVNMDEAVKRSYKTLAVMTQDWVDSEWADYEGILTQTKDPAGRRRQFIPILLKDCKLPSRIAMLTYLNFRDSANHDHELKRLLGSIRPAISSGKGVSILPYFAHPYPLPPNFTGRASERKMLTEWFTNDNHPVFVYEAIGGMGKSAVTWVWVQRDVLGLPVPGVVGEQPQGCAIPDNFRPEGVLWWSFYESDAKFGAFLNEALRYIGVKFDGNASDHDKLQALVNILYQRRFLFILDGFERELRAYASMNAAYQGEKIEQDKQGDFRACVDPRAAIFLRSIASQPLASRILMTTRLHPKELDNLAGCRHENLSSFSIEDTLAYFHSKGIKCTRAEVEETCHDCSYHPLSISLLVGMITGSLRARGEIAAIRGCSVIDNLKGNKKQHHILEASYNSLEDNLKALLSKLAAFRNPITFETASIYKEKGQSDADFESDLKNLIDRGLIYLNDEKKLDFHPIIRSYAYDRLTGKESVHSQLCDYFDKVPRPEGNVKSLDELNPVIELYHHTVRAGRFDDALNLYRSRLSNALYFQFGMYSLIIELMSGLFPDGLDNLPKLSNERNQSHALNELAIAFSSSGQSRKAVTLMERSNNIDKKNEYIKSENTGLQNLADDQLMLGRIRDAEENLRAALKLGIEDKDLYREAVSHKELGLLLSYRGRFSEAASEFNAAVSINEQDKHIQGLTLSRSYQAHAALLQGKHRSALDFSLKAMELWRKAAYEQYPIERNRVRIEWLLGWSKTALPDDEPKKKTELLNEAEQHLTEALTRCRKINLIEMEPDILLAWARWHRAKGNPDEARKCCDDALDIADRCEYRLKQADIHNFLALLDLDAGNLPEAKHHAEIGKERAYCDGPPYHYKPAYEESERLLKEIASKK